MQSIHRDGPPWLLQYRSSTVFIIATVWISSFTDYFLYAMVVPILPTALVERADVPYKDREYWVSVLLMCEAATAFICCPIFGYIVDVAPTRRLPYVLGLIFLGASMGLLWAARSTATFVIARLLQGGATAMVAVAGLALLTDSVPLDNLGQTIGYQGSAIALGFLFGPLLGGLVYDKAGYEAVFGMSFALVGLDLIMRVLVVEKKVAGRWIDPPSADQSSSTSSATIRPKKNVAGRSIGCSPTTTSSSASSMTIRAGGGYQTFADTLTTGSDIDTETETTNECEHGFQPEYGDELVQAQPTLLQIAKQPRVVISSFGLLIQGLLFSAFDATIPIFVETHFNWTPLGAGLAFLPSALTALFEPFFGYLSDKYGTRVVTFTSFILLPLPLASLSIVSANRPTHIALLLSLLTAIGLLINLATPALYVEAQDVLDAMQPQDPPHPSSSESQNEHPSSSNSNMKTHRCRTCTGAGAGGAGGGGIAQAFGIQTMAQFLGMFLGSLWGGFVEWRFGWRAMAVSLSVLTFVTAWGMLFLGEKSLRSSWFPWVRENRKDGRVLGGDESQEDGERERLLSSAAGNAA
ncbi:major facilitator superfamily domain-containing protein [Aspergillus granulosus]|uniref:Major facilitator superfamily domain-containing protein n=1 Tax=Aspergillus granulosus TaxID=176169 RepID=A0ABR4HIW2_9EURO